MKWFIFLCLFPLFSYAQEPVRPELDPSTLIENLLPNQSENITEDVLDNLYQLFQQPLDLNSATFEELSALYILSEKQLTSFFQYRQQAGPLVSLYELQAIPDFDLRTIQRLLPFVRIQNQQVDGSAAQYVLLRYDRSLELRRGFIPDAKGNIRYLGQPYRLFTRYKGYANRQFSFGFTAKHDAGEPWSWQPAMRSYGVDYISFHGFVQNYGKIKRIAVGDYQLQLGQGLLTAGGFYLGKGSEPVLSIRRSSWVFVHTLLPPSTVSFVASRPPCNSPGSGN
ncbi:hypothetical protein BWI93_21940 [Siphonobacter sp. BAB-5385]|uniref:ComEA family DNA-binding protein n=1 Tax=Siphonobacter sp. BAB-5385 TaxID=1864822 RepID=UPI000B9E2DB8|nr:helix-hairpin-helix domain-containing protein [Siphonobacter sp. BAB-5385]OZI06162.1 hypothetical protein BWI93_21940 [Siphonobacter sp. BAB-5385]